MPYLSHRHLNRLLNEEYDRGQAIGLVEGRDLAAVELKEAQVRVSRDDEKTGFIDYRGQDLRREAAGIAVALLPYSPEADPLTIAADVAKFLETGDVSPAGVQEQEASLYHDENTLNKVREIIDSCVQFYGNHISLPNDIVLALQNAGILFRERAGSEPETDEGDESAATPEELDAAEAACPECRLEHPFHKMDCSRLGLPLTENDPIDLPEGQWPPAGNA